METPQTHNGPLIPLSHFEPKLRLVGFEHKRIFFKNACVLESESNGCILSGDMRLVITQQQVATYLWTGSSFSFTFTSHS